jgi:hypothetical protein
MPIFDTPTPLAVTLDVEIASVRIVASDRADTVVEVRPDSVGSDADERAAANTEVTCSDGRLLVKGPRKRSLFGRNGGIEVRIELPTGSGLAGSTPLVDVNASGRLGECRFKTSVGSVRIEEAASVRVQTGHGTLRVDRVTGDAALVGVGRVEVGRVDGTADVRNHNGSTTIDTVGGDLRVNSANGDIVVGVARADVRADTAFGTIRIGEVARGRVTLHSGAGEVEVGVREATAAWLDVHTQMGKVRNSLEGSDGPAESEETVEVRARTGLGDIVIRRA